MARFNHQPDRSYRHWNWNTKYGHPSSTEVQRHVANAVRLDADPVFNEIAHTAAMIGLKRGYTGREGVCFMQPTDNPRGYFSLLKFINSRDTCTRKDIIKVWKANPCTTLTRLIDGGLISFKDGRDRTTHRLCYHFFVTDLGKAYLNAAKRYLVKRKGFTKKYV